MTKKIKGNKGFTLIEIIVAIAIIGLLSGTLLQMFVLSTKMNSKADNLDKANTLATSIAEDFKSGTQADLFFKGKSVSVFDEKESAMDEAEGKRQYKKFYDASWKKPAEGVNPSFSLTATVWMGSTQNGTTNIFTPDNICETIDLDPNVDNYELEVDNDAYTIKNTRADSKDLSSFVTIGFRFNFNAKPINKPNYNINVTNNTNTPVELYIYGTDEAKMVSLNPLKGESRISYIPTADLKEGNNTNLNQYLLEVKIKRIDDGVVLTDYNVSKYFVKTGG